MISSSTIRVMISSRCSDKFPLSGGRKLSSIRKELQEAIEKVEIFGQRMFEVSINETTVKDGSLPAWAHCMTQVDQSDIFIVLYNGNAGWLGTGQQASIGICHAEYSWAQNTSPGKVYVVNILEDSDKGPRRPADKNFQKDLAEFGSYAATASDEPSLLAAVKMVVADATIDLVHRGRRDASRGKRTLGPSLDWSRKSYEDRVEAMVETVVDTLVSTTGGQRLGKNNLVRTLSDARLLYVVSAVPDSMSVSAARELVGQPHLLDPSLAPALKGVDGGPIHIVACHKGVTESQAIRMLGFPDATIVAASFGIYVLDPVQGIQMMLLSQCRDRTTTQINLQSIDEWLREARQSDSLVKYAIKRRKIVDLLAM